ncbi:hypothetical protein [Leptolinea tardivitalis]|uniref:Peptidase C39-like domain-containing protein n=1 Tax=Leptolinea tardivitalis TaxID=229920 RepID=A0A0P6WZE1_9CHLR|nr:hypothetical protein [Leptolinea tardivitalis]KPL72141.1 hypothetical protein ADM99_08335 [Leptolinea tardivitalis]GAP20609.1 hypothetical protein LTAR_00803 [Leptolinea tardivitalis]
MKKADFVIRVLVLFSMIVSLLAGPGFIPASVVSAKPSAQEEIPTTAPGNVPTDEPTATPTEIPTEVPTSVPTEVPTEEPVIIPTDIPTEIPSPTPTVDPSLIVTEIPTATPTETVSVTPTITETPTETPESEGQPFSHLEFAALDDGTPVEELVIIGSPNPPEGIDRPISAIAMTEGETEGLTNPLAVPAYNWVYGCSSVSAAMVAGFYDRGGYPNIYTGPTDGGVMPMNNSVWPTWTDSSGDTYPNLPLAASKQGGWTYYPWFH